MKVLKLVGALVSLCLILAIGIFYWAFSRLNAPIEHTKAEQYIVIERGSTPEQIINKLSADGIVQNPWLTSLYIKFFDDAAKMQAGTYKFPSPISPIQVLKTLEKGEDLTTKLVIPEGFTRFDIAKRIVEKFPQNPPTDYKQVLLLMEDTSLVKDIAPNAKNLEGYMYPSTYSFPVGTKAEAIIKTVVEQFKKKWKPEWSSRAKAIGRTPEEVITIASLVETESSYPDERLKVASVIYNRLAKNIPLGIDQTVVYVAKMNDKWDGTIHQSDINADSPYNTRKYAGIPPGPISSVTESSIEAALNPATTDYIYYVLNVQANNGSHNFYSSAGDFERGKVEYQRWLEQQRGRE